jgi:hypothetical protein
MERSYRPALDGKPPLDFNGSVGSSMHGGEGLGLSSMGGAGAAVINTSGGAPPNGGYRGVRPTGTNPLSSNPTVAAPQRAYSFAEEKPRSTEQERVRRKPLPTIGTGGGVGGSPLMGGGGGLTPTGPAEGTEPWLPVGARR